MREKHKMSAKMAKLFLKASIILLIIIQLIPYGRNHTNPPVVSEPDWNSIETKDLFFQTCQNCHSNETDWPWYSHIAPVSWLIQHDVNEGREHFNVSLWGIQKHNEGKEAAEELQEGDMPPWFYYISPQHQKLSAKDKIKLISGLVETFGQESDDHDDDHEHED